MKLNFYKDQDYKNTRKLVFYLSSKIKQMNSKKL